MPGGGRSERPVWRAVLPALFVVGAGEWARVGGVFGPSLIVVLVSAASGDSGRVEGRGDEGGVVLFVCCRLLDGNERDAWS